MKNFDNIQLNESFDTLANDMRDTINLALYKCNIKYKDYDEFRSYALEGLWITYKLFEEGKIKEKELKAFAYKAMRSKIIDEIRRRARRTIVLVDNYENLKIFEAKEFNIELIDFLETIKKLLTKQQQEIFELLLVNKDIKDICKMLAISKSKCYNLVSEIKEISENILYNKE